MYIIAKVVFIFEKVSRFKDKYQVNNGKKKFWKVYKGLKLGSRAGTGQELGSGAQPACSQNHCQPRLRPAQDNGKEARFRLRRSRSVETGQEDTDPATEQLTAPERGDVRRHRSAWYPRTESLVRNPHCPRPIGESMPARNTQLWVSCLLDKPN